MRDGHYRAAMGLFLISARWVNTHSQRSIGLLYLNGRVSPATRRGECWTRSNANANTPARAVTSSLQATAISALNPG